jgi:MFS family permease
MTTPGTFADHYQMFTALYYIPFYFMAVQFSSPVRSGIQFFPTLFLLLPGSVVVAALTTRLGRFRWAIWIGWTVSIVGVGLFILFDVHTKTAVWATALAIMGIGLGMILTSVNVAVQAISHVKDAAMAASMYGFMRSLGMPIGTAVSLLRSLAISMSNICQDLWHHLSKRDECQIRQSRAAFFHCAQRRTICVYTT